MKPWERRLKDLSQILQNCHSSYLDPDLFRMNTNQFLQTARTVTFIIQKNKAEIPDYDNWYAATVLSPLSNDTIMTWAKDARNIIEKQGDLEFHSTLNVSLIFSYLQYEDIEIKTNKLALLDYGIKKLIRFAQKNLPTGIQDASVIKIERRWVTTSLPDYELLHALAYVYTRLYECCNSLANQFNNSLEKSIPWVDKFHHLRDGSRQVSYIKLNNLKTANYKTDSIHFDSTVKIPALIKKEIDVFKENNEPANLENTFELYTNMAKLTFKHFGNHVPMLFLLDNEFKPIKMTTINFEDQVDKFIFWRQIAHLAETIKVKGLVWISESWIRQYQPRYDTALRNLPIIGEQLRVLVFNINHGHRERIWNIVRSNTESIPMLDEVTEAELDGITPNYLIPVLQAMNVENPEHFFQTNAASQGSPACAI